VETNSRDLLGWPRENISSGRSCECECVLCVCECVCVCEREKESESAREREKESESARERERVRERGWKPFIWQVAYTPLTNTFYRHHILYMSPTPR